MLPSTIASESSPPSGCGRGRRSNAPLCAPPPPHPPPAATIHHRPHLSERGDLLFGHVVVHSARAVAAAERIAVLHQIHLQRIQLFFGAGVERVKLPP